MAFIIFYFFFLKKFEKVEKTGFFRAKFLLHCTLSFILGNQLNVKQRLRYISYLKIISTNLGHSAVVEWLTPVWKLPKLTFLPFNRSLFLLYNNPIYASCPYMSVPTIISWEKHPGIFHEIRKSVCIMYIFT